MNPTFSTSTQSLLEHLKTSTSTAHNEIDHSEYMKKLLSGRSNKAEAQKFWLNYHIWMNQSLNNLNTVGLHLEHELEDKIHEAQKNSSKDLEELTSKTESQTTLKGSLSAEAFYAKLYVLIGSLQGARMIMRLLNKQYDLNIRSSLVESSEALWHLVQPTIKNLDEALINRDMLSRYANDVFLDAKKALIEE